MDLTGYDTVILTLEDSAGTQIDVTGPALTVASGTVTAQLTQAQTLALKEGRLKLQLRASRSGGATAMASNIMQGELTHILKDGAI